jgi:Fe-Mn family superoxide dismutase
MPLDTGKSPFTLPKLPYADDALAPVISANTISFHHGKHHKAYVDNLNNLIKDTPYAELTLGEIIKKSAKDEKGKGIFNNSAQVWNHDFYWHSMSPKGSTPSAKVSQMLDESFGGLEKFQAAFKAAAVGQFGSGWAWLVSKGGKLAIETTGNADTPLAHGGTPLLVADVWEHAYYLDFQNRRPDHIQAWMEKLINWAWVEENLG